MSSYVVKGEIKDVFGQIMGLARVSKGLEFIELDQPQTIEDQKVMVTIEAPTFAEEKRAQHYADASKTLG